MPPGSFVATFIAATSGGQLWLESTEAAHRVCHCGNSSLPLRSGLTGNDQETRHCHYQRFMVVDVTTIEFTIVAIHRGRSGYDRCRFTLETTLPMSPTGHYHHWRIIHLDLPLSHMSTTTLLKSATSATEEDWDTGPDLERWLLHRSCSV
ncbi:unnamed protein product [Cuscuta campestris]|uniref:Uncharacterized protein n=1 Tax=Cuscuta campestris TaxID=132261 RepID=A0A484MM58_9ASTE|nr:unnamed protein product [Cuscuta campestris]